MTEKGDGKYVRIVSSTSSSLNQQMVVAFGIDGCMIEQMTAQNSSCGRRRL